MTFNISRRKLISSSIATAGALSLTSGVAGVIAAQDEVNGGIGWPREQFDAKFGVGEDADGLTIYANPYVPESRLAVLFDGGVATFIDILLPPTFPVDDELGLLTSRFLPPEPVGMYIYRIPSVDGTPEWQFTEYYSEELGRAGSGSPWIMRTTAFNADGIVRFTLSLAGAESGTGFASTENSVGVWNTIDEFSQVYGEASEGNAAMGHYEGFWDIEPWSTVKVSSVNMQEQGAMITEISAVSNDGASEEDAVAFANGTLPQSATLVAGYSSYPVPDRSQGWGMSSWQNPDGSDHLILFILGDGIGAGTVLQVASAKKQDGF